MRHQGLGTGGQGRGNGNGNTFIREGTRRAHKRRPGHPQGVPLRGRCRGERESGSRRLGRRRAGTRPAPTGACGGRRPQKGALAMDGSRSAYEGRHKACPYRRVRREAAAKGALAMDGSRSAYEGRHKACPYRRVRREAAAKGGTCDGWDVAARTRAGTRPAPTGR